MATSQKISGKKQYVGWGKETVFGTSVNPTIFSLWEGFQSHLTKDYEKYTPATGNLASYGAFSDTQVGNWSGKLKLNAVDGAYALSTLASSDVVSLISGTAYSHIMPINGNTNGFYSIEHGRNFKTFGLLGAITESAQIEIAKGIIEANFSGSYKDEVDNRTVSVPSYSTLNPLRFSKTTISLNGTDMTGDLIRGSININKSFAKDDFRANSNTVAGFLATGLTIEGELQFVLNTPAYAYRTQFLNNAYTDLMITLDSGILIGATDTTYKMVFDMDRVSIQDFEMGNEEDGMLVKLKYEAHTDGTISPLVLTSYNDVSTSYI